MNSSSEFAALATPELRTGEWTRFGADSVLGDAVTEHTMSTLAESTRAVARSQGYSVGWAEGQRHAREQSLTAAVEHEQFRLAAEADRAVEHATAVTALEKAAAELRIAAAQICAAIEDRASELAWEITRELVGHELRSAEDLDVIRRVLNLLPDHPVAAVRLHPEDVPGSTELAAHGVSVIADPSLDRGDALVEAADHVLDLRLDGALQRIREVLQ